MTNNAVTKEMLKNPALLSALQGKLDSMAGTTSGYIEVSYNQIFALGKGMNNLSTTSMFTIYLQITFQSLPPAVKRRIKSLKKLQLETTKIEAKFYEEVSLTLYTLWRNSLLLITTELLSIRVL